MTPIKNIAVYNAGMRKSMMDKIWWIDKIDDDINTVMDYGCADGALLSMIHDMSPDLQLCGYDFNEAMINLATQNVPFGNFSDDFYEGYRTIGSYVHTVWILGNTYILEHQVDTR